VLWIEAAVAVGAGDAQAAVAMDGSAAGGASASEFGRRGRYFAVVTTLASAADRLGDLFPLGPVVAAGGRQGMGDFVQDGVAHFGFVVQQHQPSRQADHLFAPVALAEALDCAIEFKSPTREQAVFAHEVERESGGAIQFHESVSGSEWDGNSDRVFGGDHSGSQRADFFSPPD
jgi:hypothetical protein